MIQEFSQLETYFAFREKSGPVTFFSFAEENATASLAKIHLQKFHFPKSKHPSLWDHLPNSFSFAFTQKSELQISSDSRKQKSRLRLLSELKEDWQGYCSEIDKALLSGALQKVVPARTRCYEVSDALAFESRALETLFSIQGTRTFQFAVKTNGSVFFGATPELLFERKDGKILVPAIAGTRTPGQEKELFESKKEQEEHRIVVDGIKTNLRALGLNVFSPTAPEILSAPGLIHLYTPIEANDDPSISNAAIRDALHPTPAIGGSPKIAAIDFIYANEPWDRGLFSSPILIELADRTLCFVAIRSALFRDRKLHLFAGAGYVEGSTAEAEWIETGKKMNVMLSILGEEVK